MFKIVKNNIPDKFDVFYEDEYGNRAHFEREEGGFYMRLRPRNKAVVVPVVHVSLPLKSDDTGIHLKLQFSDHTDHGNDKDIKAMLDGAGELLSRWICLVSDVAVLNFNPSEMHIKDPEAYARLKIESLLKYEELSMIANNPTPTRNETCKKS